MKLTMTASRRSLVLAAALALFTSLTNTASASPSPSSVAPSTVSSCTVGWPSTSCKTGTIGVTSDHEIFYYVCPAPDHYADWQIKDAGNDVIVGQGRVSDGTCVSGFIHGLFGTYWGWVFNTRGGAYISISNA
jgi:hypothetical protein